MASPPEEARSKIVNLIQQALTDTDVPSDYYKDLEIGIYNWCIQEAGLKRISRNWSNPKFYKLYMEKSRSIIFNLKNSKSIVKRIKEGDILPHEMPFMKPEHVNPEIWEEVVSKIGKKYENAYEKKDIFTSEMFKCGRCHQRKVTYYESQQRASDEPATLHIHCTVCGHKWRIG